MTQIVRRNNNRMLGGSLTLVAISLLIMDANAYVGSHHDDHHYSPHHDSHHYPPHHDDHHYDPHHHYEPHHDDIHHDDHGHPDLHHDDHYHHDAHYDAHDHHDAHYDDHDHHGNSPSLHGSVHPDDHHDHDVVIVSLALNWDHLWHQGASLKDVSQEHRDHTVHEVLMSISDEMYHRHEIEALSDFHMVKMQDNLALVEYPHLSGWDEVDLNLCANDLLQIHDIVLNVNIFVNNHPIHIVDLGLEHHDEHWGHDGHYFNEHGEHLGIDEGALSGERLLEHHDWMDHHDLWHKTTGTYKEQVKEVEDHIHEFET